MYSPELQIRERKDSKVSVGIHNGRTKPSIKCRYADRLSEARFVPLYYQCNNQDPVRILTIRITNEVELMVGYDTPVYSMGNLKLNLKTRSTIITGLGNMVDMPDLSGHKKTMHAFDLLLSLLVRDRL